KSCSVRSPGDTLRERTGRARRFALPTSPFSLHFVAWPVIVVGGHVNDTDPLAVEKLQVIHLRAFVRAFKCAADGDYHLEVADSGASTARAAEWFFDARSVRRRAQTRAHSGWCRMRPIREHPNRKCRFREARTPCPLTEPVPNPPSEGRRQNL